MKNEVALRKYNYDVDNDDDDDDSSSSEEGEEERQYSAEWPALLYYRLLSTAPVDFSL